MDRRGFLGALAALPIVAKFSPTPEKELEEIAHNLYPPKEEAHLVAGSGTFITEYPICSG